MTYGIRTTSKPPALVHVSEAEAVIYTEGMFNSQRDRKKGEFSYWHCYVWGSAGIGDNPIQALASACENWVRWNEPEYVQKAIAEYVARKPKEEVTLFTQESGQ